MHITFFYILSLVILLEDSLFIIVCLFVLYLLHLFSFKMGVLNEKKCKMAYTL